MYQCISVVYARPEGRDAILEAGLWAPSGMGMQSPVLVAVQDGQVFVNGERCTMRGKKIRPGDRVQLGDVCIEVCGA